MQILDTVSLKVLGGFDLMQRSQIVTLQYLFLRPKHRTFSPEGIEA